MAMEAQNCCENGPISPERWNMTGFGSATSSGAMPEKQRHDTGQSGSAMPARRQNCGTTPARTVARCRRAGRAAARRRHELWHDTDTGGGTRASGFAPSVYAKALERGGSAGSGRSNAADLAVLLKGRKELRHFARLWMGVEEL